MALMMSTISPAEKDDLEASSTILQISYINGCNRVKGGFHRKTCNTSS